MIRLILVAIFLLLFLVTGMIPAFVFWLIGKKNPAAKDRASFVYVRWGFRVISFLSGVKIVVKGRENIPDDHPVLYVANHRGYFDVVSGYTLLTQPTGYVAKIEFRKIPLLSLWMRYIHCLFLDRSNIREGLKTILEGAEEVKKGISMWIFPEGTRCKEPEGTQLEYKEGSLKIAERSGCPIIPVAILHTDQVLERHLPFIRSTEVIFRFGEPISLSDLPRDVKKFAGAHLREVIQGMIDEELGVKPG